MTQVWTELHPWSQNLPPEAKRWRVMYQVEGEDPRQESVHETPEEAEEAAEALRVLMAEAERQMKAEVEGEPDGQDR